MAKIKLTARVIDDLMPAAKDVIVWDAEVAGFGLKVTPAGKRVFLLYYRSSQGQQRKPAIGAFPAVRPEAARAIAKQWLSEVAKGNDPSAIRQEGRAAPDVAVLCDRYMAEHAATRKKASSMRGDKRLIDKHILPALAKKKVSGVTRANISALHHALARTPYEANRTLSLLSKAFSLAERWGLRPDGSNPARNIEHYPEYKRERFLSAEEVTRLWAVLSSPAAATVPLSAVAAIKLLMMTGRRLTEVLALEWSYVDFSTATLSLPDSKTGALRIPLVGEALALFTALKTQPDAHPRYVLRGRDRRVGGALVAGPIVNLQKPWRTLRALAGLENVRLHDLRHTYASVGAGLGLSLPVIGKLLGHTQPATTARYAHLANDPVKAAASLIDAAFTAMTAKVPNYEAETLGDYTSVVVEHLGPQSTGDKA